MAIWDIKERNDLVRANDVKGTRGLFSGGYTPPANVKRIDYITIATTGNAADFGDLTTENQSINGTSNCHGGLQA